MRSIMPISAILFLITVFVAGCGETSPPVNTEATEGGPTHSHEGGDELVWVGEDIEHDGFVLKLGHHGDHWHAGEAVEPAVSITRDGEAVPDAKVFNSLVSADGMETVGAEIATIYEPETDDEPAHYAQGNLKLPEESNQVIIRFRIALPGVDDELTRDMTIEVE